MILPPFTEALYFYTGTAFVTVAIIEMITGVALYSTLFSSFTGNHTFVKRKKDYKKYKTAIIYHFLAGICFISIELLLS